MRTWIKIGHEGENGWSVTGPKGEPLGKFRCLEDAQATAIREAVARPGGATVVIEEHAGHLAAFSFPASGANARAELARLAS